MIFKSAFIIFSSNTLAHLINYSYHFIAGHFLSPDQFGLLESFVSLNYLLAVLISSFSLSIIHQLNQTKASQKPALIQTLQSLSLKLTLIIWLLVLLTFPLLKRLLHFNNPYLLLIFSIQIFFSFLPTLYLSLLQAKLKFKEFSLVNIIAPLTKTLFALILFLLGFKLLGALTAMSLAGLVPTLFSFYLVKKHFKPSPQPPAKLPPSFIQFGLLAFITNLSLTSLYNSDVLLVRFFISHQSGLYSAASVLTKIIFFVSASILTVAYPVFTTQTKNLKKLKQSFQRSFLLVSTIAFLGVVTYQLYPHLIIKLFPSSNYLNASNLLPGFSLFIFFFTILNLFTQFLLVLNQRLAMITALVPALLQLILIFLYHQTLTQVISNSIIAALTGLILASTAIIKRLYAKS